MSVQYCMKCMNKQFAGVSVCPHCGTPYRQSLQNANALRPGHILNGKYLVGTVLGQGGFGITYIGMDLVLEKKVAIKEYFPVCTGMVSRYNASSVVWNSEINTQSGLNFSIESFLKEARQMAKVDSISCIVKVRDFFTQNNTAYIVMDYIEGETLAQKLQREGPMPFSQCVSMLAPIMQALEQVHQHGIIHRDISPDNIMVQANGKLMLLDLGTAKEIDIQKKDGSIQSSQLVAKEGFSPLEQYTSNGRIGTWTDVYAMSATVYYCCTGTLPPLATERITADTLFCRSPLRQNEFTVLKQGMALYGKNRIQTMGELLHRLLSAPETVIYDPVRVSMTAPAVLFGIQAVGAVGTAFILKTLSFDMLLRIVGYLIVVFALLRACPSRKLFSVGSISLCLAYWLAGSQADWAGGMAMLSAAALLLPGQLGIPKGNPWLQNYWFIPAAIFCVYLVMSIVESFDIFSLFMGILTCFALAMVMHKFAFQQFAIFRRD